MLELLADDFTPKSQSCRQLPPLVWCILKASRHLGVKRPRLRCLCFVAVQETTPLLCSEALRVRLWGCCERGSREMKEGRNDGGREGLRQSC